MLSEGLHRSACRRGENLAGAFVPWIGFCRAPTGSWDATAAGVSRRASARLADRNLTQSHAASGPERFDFWEKSRNALFGSSSFHEAPESGRSRHGGRSAATARFAVRPSPFPIRLLSLLGDAGVVLLARVALWLVF